MKQITLNKDILFTAVAVIVIIACIISPLSNFIDTKINDLTGIAWITKADKGPGFEASQRYGNNLQIRLLVEDNGVF